MPDSPVILGIESSCDETAAAVVGAGVHVLSNVVASQHDLHRRYAGVVPELASRAHLERIGPVIREALSQAGITRRDLDAVAVGHRPGLIGSLLVGVSAAKALAWALRIPLIGIDHLAAHLGAAQLDAEPIEYPALGLVVSGGHTSLYSMKNATDLTLIGRTIDDAVGEAYDKAATILGLGYPGGPLLDELAQQGDATAIDLPVSRLGPDSLDFSFSGLKTALLYAVRGKPQGRRGKTSFQRDASSLNDRERADFAASFQRAAINAIMLKLNRALDRHPVGVIVVGGGVSANSRLRAELKTLGAERSITVRLPEMAHCVDNAAMIAGLAAEYYKNDAFDDWTLSAEPSSAIC